MGFAPGTAQRMEAVQRDINTIEFGWNGRRAPHHDLLIPHWKKLAKALTSRATSLDTFKAVGVSLPLPVLDPLLSSLQTCGVTEFELISTDMGRTGILRLSSFLGENTSLVKLTVAGEDMQDTAVAGAFADAISAHTSLECLQVIACGLEIEGAVSSFRFILDASRGLKNVGLWGNNQGGPNGQIADVIADFIRSDPPVDELSFLGNSIPDGETEILATALRQNTNLRRLDLQRNDITGVGAKTLLGAVFDTASLGAIAESNHSCAVFAAAQETMSDDLAAAEVIFLNSRSELSVKEKIRKKVVLALCQGSIFDLGRFNSVPFQLIPLVLKLIQENTAFRAQNESQHTLSRDALSRVFHTLRGWKMPSLFVNLRNPHEASRKRKRNVAR